MSPELFQIVLSMLFQVPFALVVWGWGKRFDPGYKASVVLTMVPVFGYLYFYWYVYKTVRHLLDKVGE